MIGDVRRARPSVPPPRRLLRAGCQRAAASSLTVAGCGGRGSGCGDRAALFCSGVLVSFECRAWAGRSGRPVPSRSSCRDMMPELLREQIRAARHDALQRFGWRVHTRVGIHRGHVQRGSVGAKNFCVGGGGQGARGWSGEHLRARFCADGGRRGQVAPPKSVPICSGQRVERGELLEHWGWRFRRKVSSMTRTASARTMESRPFPERSVYVKRLGPV